MIQRMYHADHGYHNAYDNAEIDKMQKAGWQKQSESEFRAVVAAKDGNKAVESVEAVEAPKKPGRPKKAA